MIIQAAFVFFRPARKNTLAPIKFAAMMTVAIFAPKASGLSTRTIGKTDSPTYSNVISKPENAATLSYMGSRAPAFFNPKIGIANITMFVMKLHHPRFYLSKLIPSCEKK